MYPFVLVSALVGFVAASGYGSGGMGGNGGGGYGYHSPVPAAIISQHNVKHYDVPSTSYIKPTDIHVPPNVLPVNFIFGSASSMIKIGHKHESAPGSYKETYSQDEPHILKHTVKKPIYQEVREIISPFRKITQEIKPVHEEIQTMVARGTHYGNMGGGMNGEVGGLNGGIGGGMNGGGYGGDMNGGGGFGGGMGSNGYGYKKEGGY